MSRTGEAHGANGATGIAAIGVPPRLPVFGVGVSRADRMDEVIAPILAAARARRPLMVSALSVHALMLAATRPEMGRAIARADIVTTDGQPVRWAMNLLHEAGLRSRVCGPDLMLALCEACAREDLPVYFYGSRPQVVAELARRLPALIPGLRVAGVDPSRVRPKVFPPPVDELEDRRDADRVRESGARVVFVGLGCPLQEMWVAAQRERLGVPALCVGAAFDLHAGMRARAPQVLQDAGLEWLYRLAQDPRRLAGRYTVQNAQFLAYLARDVALAAVRRSGASLDMRG